MLKFSCINSQRFLQQSFLYQRHSSYSEVLNASPALIVDGRKLSRRLLKTYKTFVKTEIKDKGFDLPKLCVILVGNRPDSALYVEKKKKACNRIGIIGETLHFQENAVKEILLERIKELNNDPQVYGILLQLPLPENLKQETFDIIETIDKYKDLDGLTTYNLGPVCLGRTAPLFTSCTVGACLYVLKTYKVDVIGKRVCVIGKSVSVGLPLANTLSAMGATVTSCDINTRNLANCVSQSEIVVAAAGHPGLVKGEWLANDSIVLDVGINRIAKSGSEVVGDVDYGNAKNRCKLITPVPGGIGPITIAMLTQNLLKSWCIRHNVPFPFED